MYTRGTVIPTHLVVRSSSPETLEGLPEPKEIIVRLTRCVHQSATDSLSPLSRSGIATAQPQHLTTRSRQIAGRDDDMEGSAEEKIVIGKIVWQEPGSVGDTVEDSRIRHFDGEIHLPKEMQPSCGFKLFRISVSSHIFLYLPIPDCLVLVCSRTPLFQQLNVQIPIFT